MAALPDAVNCIVIDRVAAQPAVLSCAGDVFAIDAAGDKWLSISLASVGCAVVASGLLFGLRLALTHRYIVASSEPMLKRHSRHVGHCMDLTNLHFMIIATQLIIIVFNEALPLFLSRVVPEWLAIIMSTGVAVSFSLASQVDIRFSSVTVSRIADVLSVPAMWLPHFVPDELHHWKHHAQRRAEAAVSCLESSEHEIGHVSASMVPAADSEVHSAAATQLLQPPAATVIDTSSDDGCDDDGVGDCLSSNVLVWSVADNSAIPITEVRSGTQLLSVDFSRSPPVGTCTVHKIAVDHDAEQKKWVRVHTSDGEFVDMTSDHPMFATTSGQQKIGPIRAEDLVPGQDSLPVLALRRVPVQRIEHLGGGDAPPSRVRIKFTKDTRGPCCVLASMPQAMDTSTSWCFIAVGDNQAKPLATRLDALLSANGWDIMANKTTSALSFVANENEGKLRRSNSDSKLYEMRAGESEERPAFPKGSTASSVSSIASDDASRITPADVDDAEIIIGSVDNRCGWKMVEGTWERTESELARGGVKLSEFMQLPISPQGVKLSYGSLSHVVKNEACKVCVFNRKTGQSCRHGQLCYFCHAEHKPYVRPPRYGRNSEAATDESGAAAGGAAAKAGTSRRTRRGAAKEAAGAAAAES